MTHLSPDPLPNHAWRPSGRHRTAEEPTLPAHRPSRLPGQASGTPEQSEPPVPAGLRRFNALPADEAGRALLACCGSHRWARLVAAHRPYPDLDSLLAAADEAAYDLTPGDVAEALACESLTLLPDGAYSAAHMALSAAHAAYESRFGHVFVICLDDTSPEDSPDLVLTAISSRLTNDPDEERTHTAEELRRLVRGRLARSLGTTGNGAVPCL
ncbi:2-oxo-4-hydroxy-4-carboxy-5-ureidoimidazoline decarboxylase [Streptomyces sp. V3I8]|jgi:2-oxo-4-hydroxy-4-carboxy--5-ureidoimidazoline (OHCU) decarboxylase|uniref:2-oxo-4-hydroxy-4-carboxy-5-ureidoimidazoline decarboxylase n=1 Tax=Streptomyces sp. V3I8 TaxID=3042279 RepID=UPI002787B44F|nr:2-oxo-4-hydroxy-4-carboxy-5-ureidoimidazoline decarboxylase [Streptomyces sp. V3I8]MDQ1036576.1 2-oxo-4-hydroxy-4-carboxy-5-ureidoimidazoline decarboxylase [Streptomyces sp. V3I8]